MHIHSHCPDFWKKAPDCVHLSVKFSIQNVALRASWRKISKIFPCRTSFSSVFDKIFIEMPKFQKPSPRLALKYSVLNVWQCSESVCFDNCLVICTVTLCYVLHQTYSELWHIQHWYFLGICWHIQSYLAVLKHNHASWDINKAYSGLFRHIEHPVEPSHIHNLAIFWALAYLELDAYLKHCETLT